MGKIQVLIVEDDPIIAADIKTSLLEMGFGVTNLVESGKAALDSIAANPPDLVLMDIRLEGEMDGIETAKRINEQMPLPLIFLTANTDRTTFERAKLTQPFAFLSKPFDVFALEHSIELAIQNFSEFQKSEKAPASKENTQVLLDRIFLKDHRNRIVKIQLNEILFIQAQGNYCDIFIQGKKITVAFNLKNVTKKIDDDSFARVHRSYLINLKQLDEIGDAFLHIKGHKIPLAYSYREGFYSKLKMI